MDNARFLIAIVLAVLVIVATNLLFPGAPPRATAPGIDTLAVDTLQPPPAVPGSAAAGRSAPAGEGAAAAPGAQGPTPQLPAGSSAVAGRGAAAEGAAALAAAGAPDAGSVAAQAAVAADTVIAVSPLYRFGVSTAGGGIVRAELTRYESFTRTGPVELVPAGDGPLVDYALAVGDTVVPLRQFPFSADAADSLEVSGGTRTLRLAHRDSATGFGVELDYTFRPDHYLVSVRGHVDGLAGNPATLRLRLGPGLAVNEADSAEDARSLSYVVNGRREGITSVRLDKVDSVQVQEGPLYWTAMKNKYFLAALLTECGGDGGSCFGGAIANPVQPAGSGGATVVSTLPVDRSGDFAFSIYMGPQEYDRLAAIGHDLQDVNPWGWQVFRPILRPLSHLIVWAIAALHRVLHLGYGWVLIVFGILLQIVLWPLYARATRSQLKNMELQPVIQELQKKHKNDQEKLQKEMMRLYKEEGFNPLGGCLPMLIPYPVLITLFFVFRNTIEFRGAAFLWLPDLSRPDPLYILPIVLALSMFALQWLSLRSTPNPNQQMKIMTWVMPAFIAFFFFRLPAGLNLYYAASNLASVPRQLQIMQERRRVQQRSQREKATGKTHG